MMLVGVLRKSTNTSRQLVVLFLLLNWELSTQKRVKFKLSKLYKISTFVYSGESPESCGGVAGVTQNSVIPTLDSRSTSSPSDSTSIPSPLQVIF